MPLKHIVIVSSFVPSHNQSPVAVNNKMLRMCCDTFERVTFITSNYPVDAVNSIDPQKIELINISADFDSTNTIHNIVSYIKMQFLLLPHIRKSVSCKDYIMFWLSGPMIVPFLYCKLLRYRTIGFLYGNSRLKTNSFSIINFLKASLMKYIAINSDITCVESMGVLDQWGIDGEKQGVAVAHLYAETTNFMETIPYSTRKQVIGMCCRLVSSKCVLEAIGAFHIFRQGQPDYRLQIIGSGPLMDHCRQLIAELGETDFIEMCGWINNEKLPGYINDWKLFLNPTNYEGLPNTLVEAMCCSTPSLSTPVGGIVDLIEDGVTGWYLKNNSSAAIALALERIIGEGKMDSVADAAGKFSRERYSYSAALKTFQQIFIKQ